MLSAQYERQVEHTEIYSVLWKPERGQTTVNE